MLVIDLSSWNRACRETGERERERERARAAVSREYPCNWMMSRHISKSRHRAALVMRQLNNRHVYGARPVYVSTEYRASLRFISKLKC